MHATGFLHRDIKPDNIFVRADGRPVLIDFGAARQVLGGETKNLTAILTPGYAPLEQYSGEGKQGPWTDLYAMGGVLYRAVTDKNPPDAVTRIRGEALGTGVGAGLASVRSKYSEPFLRAIEWALNPDEKKRPQGVQQWKIALLAERRISPPAQRIPERRIARPVEAEEPRARRWPVVVVIAMIALAGAGIWKKQRTARLDAAAQAEAAAQHAAAEARLQEDQALRYVIPRAAVPPAATPKVESPAATAPAATTAASAPAAADEGVADKLHRFRRETETEFRSADANGDGFLSIEEVRNKFPLLAKEFQRADRDGDGRISPQEFFQAKRQMLERRFQKQN